MLEPKPKGPGEEEGAKKLTEEQILADKKAAAEKGQDEQKK